MIEVRFNGNYTESTDQEVDDVMTTKRTWSDNSVEICTPIPWFLENNVRCSSTDRVKMEGPTDINENLKTLSTVYGRYHGYASLCVCFSGIITNIFNITVLTRKHMRTPVNTILTALAIADIITMSSYVPFAIHFYCNNPTSNSTPEKNSKSWMTFLLFHINLTNVTHTVSIWLCVSLSIVRYIHIKSPTGASSARLRRINQAKYLVAAVYLTSLIFMVPNYLTNEMKEIEQPNNETNKTIFVLKSLKLGTNDTEPLVLANVWMYAVLAKLVPCLLISIFGGLLLYQMHSKIKLRKTFLKFSGSSHIKLQEHSRTTKMLISVIVLFLLTELPQGILIVLSATRMNFFDRVYLPLGDIMDIVALINNAINFVLYCSMSTKFRETFLRLYCRCGGHKDDRNGHALREKVDSYTNNNQV